MTLTLLRTKGACRDHPQALFFPDRSQGPNGSDPAKEICEGCPVRQECLDWALTAPEEFGVWGGTTPTERRRMRHGSPS